MLLKIKKFETITKNFLSKSFSFFFSLFFFLLGGRKCNKKKFFFLCDVSLTHPLRRSSQELVKEEKVLIHKYLNVSALGFALSISNYKKISFSLLHSLRGASRELNYLVQGLNLNFYALVKSEKFHMIYAGKSLIFTLLRTRDLNSLKRNFLIFSFKSFLKSLSLNFLQNASNHS